MSVILNIMHSAYYNAAMVQWDDAFWMKADLFFMTENCLSCSYKLNVINTAFGVAFSGFTYNPVEYDQPKHVFVSMSKGFLGNIGNH